MPDIWNGKRLQDRGCAFTEIHYRLYAVEYDGPAYPN